MRHHKGMSSHKSVGRVHRGRHHQKVAVRYRPRQAVGALVMSENGDIVHNQLSDVEMNPASVVKIVTAYGALQTFGPNHQFTTNLLTDGEIDEETGIFNGDIYVQGSDPDFDRADADYLSQTLIEQGIKQVNGKLLVGADFSYGSDPNPGRSGNSLARVWRKDGISFKKGAAIGAAPEDAEKIGELRSEMLRDTLKEMLSFSQNRVAEQIGHSVGGVRKLEEMVTQDVGLAPGSLKLATASGLGINRVKPSTMLVVLKALRTRLQSEGMDFQDILPVAGIDRGTLDDRFTGATERGSVVAKTGTLPGTDGGASALAGMFRSQDQNFYFVIFCWKGSVVGFRHQQDQLIRQLQAQFGGPKPFNYKLSQPDGV